MAQPTDHQHNRPDTTNSKQKLLHTKGFIEKTFDTHTHPQTGFTDAFTQVLLRTDAFTRIFLRTVAAQLLLHAEILTHTQKFDRQVLLDAEGLYTEALTHSSLYTKCFCAQNCLNTRARTHTHTQAHRCFDTQVPLHRCRNTQTHMECFHTFRLICAQVPAHKHLYTQRFYTDVLVHRCFYTQTLLHAVAFTHTHTVASAHKCLTHRMFYIHPLHTEMLYNFTHTNKLLHRVNLC